MKEIKIRENEIVTVDYTIDGLTGDVKRKIKRIKEK